VAHRYLTRVSDKDIQADGNDRMDGDEINGIKRHPQEVILHNEEWQNS
jgi:hypothetical protein